MANKTTIPDRHYYEKWSAMSDNEKFDMVVKFLGYTGWTESVKAVSPYALYFVTRKRNKVELLKIYNPEVADFEGCMRGLLLELGERHLTDPLRDIKTFLTMVVSKREEKKIEQHKSQ